MCTVTAGKLAHQFVTFHSGFHQALLAYNVCLLVCMPCWCSAAGSAGSATLVAPPGSGARPRETYWSQWALNMAKDALGGSSLAMWVRFSGCLNQVVVRT